MSNLNKFNITEATMLSLAATKGIVYTFGTGSMYSLLEYSQALLALATPPVASGALPELPDPTIDGTVYHQVHKICYTAPVHYTADQMRAYGQSCAAAAAPNAALVEALKGALAVIDDYLAYTHDGDPWKEDARSMGEMEINDADNDGRIESWRAALAQAGAA